MGQCQCAPTDRKGCTELFVKTSTINDGPLFELEYDAHCRLGSGLNKRPFQDAFFAIGPPKLTKVHIFGILDGFGPNCQAAHVIKNNLEAYFEQNASQISQSNIDKEIKEYLINGLKYAEDALKAGDLDYSRDGACLQIIVISKRKIYVLSLGNCDSYIYKQEPGQRLYCKKLNKTHDLKNLDEKRRVKSGGGKIEDPTSTKSYQRLWSKENELGIRATRCLGGFQFKGFLISEAEIEVFEKGQEDQFIVMGTDGLWETMTPEEIGNFILEKREEREGLAEDLVDEAAERWKTKLEKKPEGGAKVGEVPDEPNVENGMDDITGTIIYL